MNPNHHPCRAGRARVRPGRRGRPAQLAAVVAALVVLGAGCSQPQPAASSGIGDWPSFLPTPSAPAVPTGVASRPAVVAAGHSVIVDRQPGRMTIEAQGPSYPSDTPLGAEQVECTFTLTFTAADTAQSLAAGHFDVLDHFGGIHDLTVAAGESLPATVAPGERITVHLTAKVPSGEGLLRYVPDGIHVLATWDYVAETD